MLIDETLRDPGCVEVGYADGLRWTVGLAERPFADRRARPRRSAPTRVFVVTGAAGSIVSAITADLAAASGGTFHLLDLTPEPDPADPDLAALRQPTGTASSASWPSASAARGERADAGARRARAGAHRARSRGAASDRRGRGRRRHGALAPAST